MVLFKVGIITASDKGARGEREDISGRVLIDQLSGLAEIVSYLIVPDEKEALSAQMIHMADHLNADLILTSGGTGLSPRDITPEATLAVVDRLVPGIPEAMRAASMRITDRAMLSRAVAGTRGRTLIINLPGSPKAVEECLSVVLPVLEHGLGILSGEATECARQ